jgi:hypothetical protein
MSLQFVAGARRSKYWVYRDIVDLNRQLPRGQKSQRILGLSGHTQKAKKPNQVSLLRATGGDCAHRLPRSFSFFEIDRELDARRDEVEEEIENRGEAPAKPVERFRRISEL